MNETNISQRIRIAQSKSGKSVLFRNNVGSAWRGDVSKQPDGSIIIRNPQIVHFGLVKGSSDLIGYTKLRIAPEHVGKLVAVFTAIEVKTNTGRISPEQEHFIGRINIEGGIAGIARSEADAAQIVNRGIISTHYNG
jgi:hypothetical protein